MSNQILSMLVVVFLVVFLIMGYVIEWALFDKKRSDKNVK
jgi:phage shock protein PspC (stress-responsive transcriptional regulator)